MTAPAARPATSEGAATAPVPPTPPGPVQTAVAYGLVLLLSVLTAVWGAFLVPLRIGATPVPVCWLVALVATGVLGSSGGRLLGRAGAAVPVLLWLAVAVTLGTRRAEGDLVVPGSTTGIVFLLAAAVGGAVAYGAQSTRVPGSGPAAGSAAGQRLAHREGPAAGGDRG